MDTIALVAHDDKKSDMVEWAIYNQEALSNFHLVGTTGTAAKINRATKLDVKSLGHGPDFGDIRIAFELIEKRIHLLVFFIDPSSTHAHEHDIQSLIRAAVLANVPIALNRASADFFITSKLMEI